VRYACIARRRNQYPVGLMCELLEVSRSGYYAWRSRPESQRAQDDRVLLEAIKRIHAASGGVYGAPRICAELQAPRICAELQEEGYQCGRRRVARLMRQAGLRGCPKRRFREGVQNSVST
jgi:putative transposase